MAIEWSTRIDRSFSIRDIYTETQGVMSRILGAGALGADIEVLAPESLRGERGRASSLGAGQLDREWGTETFCGREGLAVFRIDEIDAMANLEIQCLPGDPDDDEAGIFLDVACWRSHPSYVLGISMILAAASVAGDYVWDESSYLSLVRKARALELEKVLSVNREPGGLLEKIEFLLGRTSIVDH